MAQLIGKDQEAGRIRGGVRPDGTALTLVALAEGLAAYVLTGVVTAQVARDRLLDEIAGLYGRSEG
ncbi:hypothetical protein GCM10020220_102500 [Nonomuraea rubra]